MVDHAFGAHTARPSELQERIAADLGGVPYLLYRDGGGNQRIRLLEESTERVTVGRDSASDIALTWDFQVSRAHTQVERMGAEWAIIDDGLSRNGTFVNGERLRGRRRLSTRTSSAAATPPRLLRADAGNGRDRRRRQGAASSSPTPSGACCRAVPPVPGQRRVRIAGVQPADRGELCVSTEAVKTHMRALFQRLGVEDLPQNRKRVRLVELAFQRGLVSSHDLDASPGT